MIIERPITMNDMVRDLKVLGVTEGMTLLVHSSLKSIGVGFRAAPRRSFWRWRRRSAGGHIGNADSIVQLDGPGNVEKPAGCRGVVAAHPG